MKLLDWWDDSHNRDRCPTCGEVMTGWVATRGTQVIFCNDCDGWDAANKALTDAADRRQTASMN